MKGMKTKNGDGPGDMRASETVGPDAASDRGGVPTAIGSTEPTAEERCHWTPEMIALAERDGESTPAEACGPVGNVSE